MKRTYILNITIMAVLVVAAAFGSACKLGSLGTDEDKDSFKTDKFSIRFPGGPDDIETEAKNGGIYVGKGTAYSKIFDNKNDNYRSYEVGEFDFSDLDPGMDEKSILKMGLNGWDKEPDTEMRYVTINGLNALDSVRKIDIGPISMIFREVVIWSAKDKKMYIVRVSASKKQNISAKEADDFVNSFKLKN